MDQYDTAINALYSPLHQARTPEALKRSAERRTRTVSDMQKYLQRIQLTNDKLPTNIIHITGTKGKGSTACMCEAIMRQRYHQTTGLFTSPHLVDIRERIRVNGKPVSKQVFGQAYWTVRRRLEDCALFNFSPSQENDDLPIMPGYFRMLALMALYVFSNYEPAIDVVILEVGMGGRYDATNILDMDGDRNVVCGVTLLDFDHCRVLGNYITQIAWEKGGIFQVKKGGADVSKRPDTDEEVAESTVESSPLREDSGRRRLFVIDTNTESALTVLRNCAAVEGQRQELHLVSQGQSLPEDLAIGIPGDHQRINAELAVALCESLAEGMSIASDGGTAAMHDALENVSWPGRCQSVLQTANDTTTINLRLDGAHTPKSLEACLKWYSSVSEGDSQGTYRALIFNCSHERSSVELLQQLVSCHPTFDAVFFCRADFERPSMVGKATARDLLETHGFVVAQEEQAKTWQETLAQVWKHLEQQYTSSTRTSKVTVSLNVAEALSEIRALTDYERIEVLVTGSLYIVGSALTAAEWTEEDERGSLLEDKIET